MPWGQGLSPFRVYSPRSLPQSLWLVGVQQIWLSFMEHDLSWNGFPLGLNWQRIHLQCWRPGFDPWVGKIPWRRERLPTPVFLSGEFHGLYSPWGHKESDTTEQLSLSLSLYFSLGIIVQNYKWLHRTNSNKQQIQRVRSLSLSLCMLVLGGSVV